MSSTPPLILLNPNNEAFVTGQSATPQDESLPYLFILRMVMSLIALGLPGFWLSKVLEGIRAPKGSAPPSLFVLAAVLAGVIVVGTYMTFRPLLRNRRFRRPCQLVIGELLSSKEVGSEDTHWLMNYRFVSPSGRTLQGKTSTEGTWVDVDARPLPQAGAQVAITYYDDRSHRML